LLLMLTSMLFTLASCGGGVPAYPGAEGGKNYFETAVDEYGLAKPTFLYSTNNPVFWSLQANKGATLTDPDLCCVVRIDIPKSGSQTMPDLGGKTYSIESRDHMNTFPGSFYVFNTHASVKKKVEAGVISFAAGSSSTGYVSGSFDVVMTDYDSKLATPPRYHLKGSFGFAIGTFGAAYPTPSEAYLQQGKDTYDQNCAQCHTLGKVDTSGGGGTDLSLRGGELALLYPGSIPAHQNLVLDRYAMQNLRIFLNTN